MNLVVFGVGHPDCGDDAAGPLVADLLANDPYVRVRHVIGDPSGMLTDALWLPDGELVVVDAVVTGADPGTVHTWSMLELLVAAAPRGGGTHDLDLTTTLRLAEALDRLPRSLTLMGIEGVRFAPGTEPSHSVLTATERVAATLAARARSSARAPELARPRSHPQ